MRLYYVGSDETQVVVSNLCKNKSDVKLQVVQSSKEGTKKFKTCLNTQVLLVRLVCLPLLLEKKSLVPIALYFKIILLHASKCQMGVLTPGSPFKERHVWTLKQEFPE